MVSGVCGNRIIATTTECNLESVRYFHERNFNGRAKYRHLFYGTFSQRRKRELWERVMGEEERGKQSGEKRRTIPNQLTGTDPKQQQPATPPLPLFFSFARSLARSFLPTLSPPPPVPPRLCSVPALLRALGRDFCFLPLFRLNCCLPFPSLRPFFPSAFSSSPSTATNSAPAFLSSIRVRQLAYGLALALRHR